MKAILRILLFFVFVAGASELNAQNTATEDGLIKHTKESMQAAAPGTYVILFRQNHNEVIEVSGALLRRIEEVRMPSTDVYLKISSNVLVKVLAPGGLAPAAGEDDFIYITDTEFDELLQDAVL